MKKGKFADRAKGIIGKPKGLGDFLEEKKEDTISDSVNTENRKTVNTEKREEDKSNSSNSVVTDIRKNGNTKKHKTVREEFRLPENLAETLRIYAFNHRTTKTAVVIEALEKFFEDIS